MGARYGSGYQTKELTMWKCFCNNNETEHTSFKEAFRRMYNYVRDVEHLTLQELETWMWIINPFGDHFDFYEARDRAYDKGILGEHGKWQE